LAPEQLTVLATATIAYPIYHYAPSRLSIHARRILGFVVLGVIPMGIMIHGFHVHFDRMGLYGVELPRTLIAALALYAIALPATFLSSRNPKLWEVYPQLRAEHWDRATYLKNAASWTIYLFGYELFFRGIIFFSMYRAFQLPGAVAITTALYVYAHLAKPAGETFGTIFMGVLFCLAAFWTGGIWAPFFAHVAIALSADSFMIRARQRATRTASAGDKR
jgi:membrane protease YdiL (CAAX protease family)